MLFFNFIYIFKFIIYRTAEKVDISGIQRIKVDKFLPISGQIPLYKRTDSFI